jgi:carbonyl reductase 1
MAESDRKRVVVTGGNAGIGFALCKQLLSEDNCFVYLGARSQERGAAAVEEIKAEFPGHKDHIHLVIVDTSSADSIVAAAKAVQEHLGAHKLYAVVNNAGVGLAAKAAKQQLLDTNFWGPKRMTDAFLPMLSESPRVVHVGSGAGPMWLKKQPEDEIKFLSCEHTWEELEAFVIKRMETTDAFGDYGLSKAGLSNLGLTQARMHPHVTFSTISPGFIDTKLVAGMGASKPPSEGTVSIRHCLFQQLPGNGWFFGSDAKRSPLHTTRDPGTEEFKGY